ncbi:MAG: hypothetical protein WD534_02915 [Phycisphaeraceae bacterium]
MFAVRMSWNLPSVVALLVAAAWIAPAWTPSQAAADDAFELEPRNADWFLVFNAIGARGRPDQIEFREHGLRPLELIYPPQLWGIPAGTPLEERPQALPRENRVRAAARYADRGGQLVCLDIEHWDLRHASDEQFEANLEKLTTVVDWMRDAAPGLRLGYYRLVPQRLNDAPRDPNDPDVVAWQEHNARLTALAEKVDVVFPSLYTIHDNPEDWRAYARANLSEARRYGKQVYVFLWPHFHPMAARRSGRDIARKPIPGDFWRAQLEFCREYADGVVIWSSWHEPWDEEAAWWQETKDFMETLAEQRREIPTWPRFEHEHEHENDDEG